MRQDLLKDYKFKQQLFLRHINKEGNQVRYDLMTFLIEEGLLPYKSHLDSLDYDMRQSRQGTKK